jgi:hypothetical protein
MSGGGGKALGHFLGEDDFGWAQLAIGIPGNGLASTAHCWNGPNFGMAANAGPKYAWPNEWAFTTWVASGSAQRPPTDDASAARKIIWIGEK